MPVDAQATRKCASSLDCLLHVPFVLFFSCSVSDFFRSKWHQFCFLIISTIAGECGSFKIGYYTGSDTCARQCFVFADNSRLLQPL